MSPGISAPSPPALLIKYSQNSRPRHANGLTTLASHTPRQGKCVFIGSLATPEFSEMFSQIKLRKMRWPCHRLPQLSLHFPPQKFGLISKTQVPIKSTGSNTPRNHIKTWTSSFAMVVPASYPSRSHAAHLYAARSGHGDFASYHDRFDHISAHTSCSSGALKSPVHFIHCRLPSSRLTKLPKGSLDKIKFLLGTPTGAMKLAQWLEKTKFFTEICPKTPL